jgi:hypothetical protein
MNARGRPGWGQRAMLTNGHCCRVCHVTTPPWARILGAHKNMFFQLKHLDSGRPFFPSFRRALVNLLKNSIYRNDHSHDFILRKSLLIQIKRILYLFIYRAVTGENYSWTDP